MSELARRTAELRRGGPLDRERAREILAPRICITGLIEQKDISGLDTHALAQQTLVPLLHHGDKPGRKLQELYAAGHLGINLGTGAVREYLAHLGASSRESRACSSASRKACS